MEMFKKGGPLKKEKSILFAVDGSSFSEEALLKTCELLKTDQDVKLTLFHGAVPPELILPSELIGQDFSPAESPEEHWNIESRKALERTKNALIESGFDPDRLNIVFEKNCKNPAVSILKTLNLKEIETIALGRWGKSTISRQPIGSVTDRIAQMAENHPLWIIDPRVASFNVMVGIVGAPVSQRVVDYAARYFGHLKQSMFTLIHVIPPVPPQYIDLAEIMKMEKGESIIGEKMIANIKEYSQKVKENMEYARNELIKAGIPERNISVKIQSQRKGTARDIIEEMETREHGILVIGRRGFKDIKDFGMGSKAYKLLIRARAFNLCMVN
jgi:nucleotide-binding universal stress UspA family protein